MNGKRRNASGATMTETYDLIVTTSDREGVPFVTAQGDVDLSTAPKLRDVLVQSCSAEGQSGPLGVDMREVQFIDSAGLALLVEIRKRFAANCQLVLVIGKGSQPERVLRLGRFDSFLRICYTPEEVTSTG